MGATLPQVKIFEAEEAIKSGAREIDMVQNIGALKSGNDEEVAAEIQDRENLVRRASRA